MTPNPNNALVFPGNHSNSLYATHCLIPQNQGGFRFMFPFVCPTVNQGQVHPNGSQKSPMEVASWAAGNKLHRFTKITPAAYLFFFVSGGEHLDWTFQHFQLLGSDEAIEPIKNQSYPHTLGKGRKLVIFKHTLNIGGPIDSPTNQRSRGIWPPDGAVEGPQKMMTFSVCER